ncbi:MAG: 4Fe-4S binding protein [Candidatus Methanoperedens sp.]|nr:4Fe-4S binding protein [Candidatus Methanoperedens sp.]MCE8425921.1 4Fe-4S binding protein [Candidatus Methanoperedens sp.]MCE8427532.1 4Fe-4S binding protein [Candidatus Methanoperedens sp.]
MQYNIVQYQYYYLKSLERGGSFLLNINKYKCGYCGACVGVCPENALELVETWLEVDNNCKNCGICVKLCPMGALELVK